MPPSEEAANPTMSKPPPMRPVRGAAAAGRSPARERPQTFVKAASHISQPTSMKSTVEQKRLDDGRGGADLVEQNLALQRQNEELQLKVEKMQGLLIQRVTSTPRPCLQGANRGRRLTEPVHRAGDDGDCDNNDDDVSFGGCSEDAADHPYVSTPRSLQAVVAQDGAEYLTPRRAARCSGTPRLDCGGGPTAERRLEPRCPDSDVRHSRRSGTPRLDCSGRGPATDHRLGPQDEVSFAEMTKPRRLSLEKRAIEAPESQREAGVCGVGECTVQ
eukprot:TRINITY_DN7278_c0_g1_i2.p1 TRINITY_DN7278_c0_g1~~TRINITY_DN7278_c0_g1_i2.p1  ORF type:complete len:273 (-),score=47.35 TRINITY_DN7278_c0_g1_i2:188-1006(-)